MKRAVTFILSCIFIFSFIIYAGETKQQQAGQNPLRLHIECGQLSNKPLVIYVEGKDFLQEEKPWLELYRPGEEWESLIESDALIDFFPAQSFKINVDGNEVSKTGTMFLFNISKLKLSLYPAKKYVAVLKWIKLPVDTSRGEPEYQKLAEEFFVGNKAGAAFLSGVILLFVLGILLVAIKGREERLIDFITLSNKSISLSLFQGAIWTIAIGVMVIYFGLIQSNLPNIPETLLMLMGLSGATGVVGHYQSKQINEDKLPKGSGILFEMLCIETNKGCFLSLAKAQLLFWTIASVFLFLVKSVFNGELWDVPVELVGLMGISQATFIGRYQQAIIESKPPSGESGRQNQQDPKK